METTNTPEEIQHPVVRGVLQYYQVNGVEVFHHGDLPAGGGLGSSSAFTVGMVNAMYNLTGGYQPHPKLLASEAIHIERNVLGEKVGNQDQVAVAFGGLNKISFFQSGDDGFEFEVEPVLAPLQKIRNLENHLLLIFAGLRPKIASDVASSYDPKVDMSILTEYVDAGVKALHADNPVMIGELLDLSWQHKKKLSPATTTDEIDALYEQGLKAGAVGGKLLGAGGGGFFLFCVPPEKRQSLVSALHDYIQIPLKLEFFGSRVVVT